MTHVWTWGGKYFGYREGDELWTYTGLHIGHFHEQEICDRNGKYLGEVMNGNRLIINKGKKSKRFYSFTPYSKRMGIVKYMNYIGYIMYMGHEEFPPPEEFSQ